MELFCAERPSQESQFANMDPVVFEDHRVIENLLCLEANYLPKCDYFSCVQPDMKPFMRKVVTTWMLEVCEEQRCEDQVFPLAVNFLDRFLCACPILKTQLQLSSAACLLIASKIRQSNALSIYLLSFYTDNSITPHQLRSWELLVLSKLNWDITAVTGYDFATHVIERCSLSGCHNLIRSHTHTLVALAYTEPEFIMVPASIIGSAGIVAAVRGLRMAESEDVLRVVCGLTRCREADVEAAILKIEAIVADETASLQLAKQAPFPTVQPSKLQAPTNEKPETPKEVQDIHF